MSSVQEQVEEILEQMDDLQHRIARLAETPRLVVKLMACSTEWPSEWSLQDEACDWSGPAVVLVWSDEALWVCGHGHRNSAPVKDFA